LTVSFSDKVETWEIPTEELWTRDFASIQSVQHSIVPPPEEFCTAAGSSSKQGPCAAFAQRLAKRGGCPAGIVKLFGIMLLGV